jgi:hypothetical protein
MDVKSLKRETVTTGGPSGLAPGSWCRGENVWAHQEIRPTKKMCWHKHMISRRLGASSTFFNPFLSQKSLISRRLWGFAWKNSRGKAAANQTDRRAFSTANPDNYRGKWTRMNTNGKGPSPNMKTPRHGRDDPTFWKGGIRRILHDPPPPGYSAASKTQYNTIVALNNFFGLFFEKQAKPAPNMKTAEGRTRREVWNSQRLVTSSPTCNTGISF